MEDPYGNNSHTSDDNNNSDNSVNYSTIPPVTPVPPTPSSYISQENEIPPLKPSSWLWQSIVATVLCCLPFGVVGIVYAARVDSLYYNRRYDEAEASSRKAKTWTLVSVVVGLVYLVFWIVAMATGNMPSYLENIIENNASGYNF
ncbi:MAG TPA: CD225/dispanin family protein [Bacteroidales bacterium]|nr:CD225/dispanin family protein [Bacteroidales bacterium]